MKNSSIGYKSLRRKLLRLTVSGLNVLALTLALPLLLLSLPVLFLSWLIAHQAYILDTQISTFDE